MAQRRKLTDEQIVGVVKQLEAGRTAAEAAREIGVSTYTIYSWKAKFGGLEPNEATKLRHLEDENGRLKKLVAELALDKEMSRELCIPQHGLDVCRAPTICPAVLFSDWRLPPIFVSLSRTRNPSPKAFAMICDSPSSANAFRLLVSKISLFLQSCTFQLSPGNLMS